MNTYLIHIHNLLKLGIQNQFTSPSMKLYMMFTLLVLSSFLTYKVQGIRLGKASLLSRNHQDIIKISSVKTSNQDDDQLLAKTADFSSGTNRKLMTEITFSGTITTIAKNAKNDENKHNPKPEFKSTHRLIDSKESSNSSSENSKHWKKEVVSEQYPDAIDITGMDYTPARKKSPIHN